MCVVPLVGKCVVYQRAQALPRRAHVFGVLVASVLRVYAINGGRLLFPALVLFFSLILPIATNLVSSPSKVRIHEMLTLIAV